MMPLLTPRTLVRTPGWTSVPTPGMRAAVVEARHEGDQSSVGDGARGSPGDDVVRKSDSDTKYRHLELALASEPPSESEVMISPDKILLSVGTAVAVRVAPKTASGEPVYDAKIELHSKDVLLVDIRRTVLDGHIYVIWGNQPGRTCLQVAINSKKRECIEVVVKATDD